MLQTARFRFHGSLNDFLPRPKRDMWLAYTFASHQTLKDMIEAIGVPHLEVREVLVNEKRVSFSQRLQPGDRVAVYPYEGWEAELMPGIAERKFVLDVQLGTLARALRMLGFDTIYDKAVTDQAIVRMAEAGQRIVLTRDVNLLKNKAIPVGYWLRSQQTEGQLTEVVRRFRLLKHIKPFTRCLVCNGLIREVAKQDVLGQLPPKTQLYYDRFYQCSQCRRIYWKGSHYTRMQELVRKVAAGLD